MCQTENKYFIVKRYSINALLNPRLSGKLLQSELWCFHFLKHSFQIKSINIYGALTELSPRNFRGTWWSRPCQGALILQAIRQLCGPLLWAESPLSEPGGGRQAVNSSQPRGDSRITPTGPSAPVKVGTADFASSPGSILKALGNYHFHCCLGWLGFVY